MKLSQFIKKRPHLVWGTDNYDGLSEEAIVGATLQYGDFSDVKKLLHILGIKEVARIFRTQLRRKRHNYSPNIAHFFTLYFKEHAGQ